jgi:hypothetical protein
MASLSFRRKTGILVSGTKWLGPQLLMCVRNQEDFNVSRTPKKQATSRPQQKREPQLGQKEARLERESNSDLHHMEKGQSSEHHRPEDK